MRYCNRVINYSYGIPWLLKTKSYLLTYEFDGFWTWLRVLLVAARTCGWYHSIWRMRFPISVHLRRTSSQDTDLFCHMPIFIFYCTRPIYDQNPPTLQTDRRTDVMVRSIDLAARMSRYLSICWGSFYCIWRINDDIACRAKNNLIGIVFFRWMI